MKAIPKELIIDATAAGVGPMLDLYEADFSKVSSSGQLLRWHSGLNELYTDIVWKGQTYNPWPIAVEGFDMKSEGTYSRPTMTVANITGLITGINHDFDDALGVVITRRQVPVKYLDAANFTAGNPNADPTQEVVSRYVVEELVEETFEKVTYNLATPVDCDNAVIPGRTILADVCQWAYRGDGCGYAGPDVADEKDNPTTSGSYAGADRCSHRRSGCRLRFPRPAVLPISSFPGAQKVT